MSAESTHILFLGGASGVGKTSVSFEVSAALRRSRVAHALVDGDNLDASYPGPLDSGRPWLSLTNLSHIWGTYRETGQHRLVYVNTVSVLETEELRRAVDPAASVTAVLLEADPAERADRLRGREHGAELDEHLVRSERWAADLRSRAPEWVTRLDTTGATVTAVAEAVVALTGWAEPRPAGTGEAGHDVRRWV